MTSYRSFLAKFTIAAALLMSFSSCMYRDKGTAPGNATFYVDSITPSFAPNKVNANGDVSQKFINLKACLKDISQRALIMNVPFAVQAGSVSINRTTDMNGCMTWQETFEFNPKNSERQIAMTRNFIAQSGHFGTVVANIAYNPWHDDLQYLNLGFKAQSAEQATIVYSPGATINRVDSFTGQNFTTQVDIQAKLQSTQLVPLDIANMRLDFLKRDFDQYEISPTLNLTIAHRYRLNFVVNAVTQTLDHGQTLQPLNQGKFRFYFMLLGEGYDSRKKGSDDPMKYVIGSTQFDTEGVVGRFRNDITLKFDKISALASRMTGILTVESIDQPNTFQVSTFEGMVTPVAGAGTQTLDLIPSKVDGKTLYADYNAFRHTSFQLKGFEMFSKFSGFTLLKKPAEGSYTKNDVTTYSFDSILKSKKLPDASKDANFAQAVCFNYFIGTGAAERSAYDACMADARTGDPSKPRMLTVALRDFVVKVNDPRPVQTGIPQTDTITISSGLDFTDKADNEEGATYKKDKNLFGDFGVSLGFGNTTAAFSGTIEKVAGKIPGVGTFMNILKFFGLTADAGVKVSWNGDWYYSSGVIQNQTQSGEISTSHSQLVTSEAFTFNINVASATCLLMTPAPELAKLLEGSKISTGQYICSQEQVSGIRQETYYFINQNDGTSSSPMSDSMSSADNPLRMFIRGPQTFELFDQLLTQNNIDLRLRKVSVEKRTEELKNELDQLDHYLTQEFPGMLTADPVTVTLPKADAPSMKDPASPAGETKCKFSFSKNCVPKK